MGCFMKKVCFVFLFLMFFSCAYSNPNLKTIVPHKFVIKDVPIPNGMIMVNKDSCLVKVLSRKAKHLVFKGQIDPISLFDYYMVFMRKNNWHLRTYIKCESSLLIFEKFPRICVIFIDSKTFSTYLHIFELNDINFLKKIPIREESITK